MSPQGRKGVLGGSVCAGIAGSLVLGDQGVPVLHRACPGPSWFDSPASHTGTQLIWRCYQLVGLTRTYYSAPGFTASPPCCCAVKQHLGMMQQRWQVKSYQPVLGTKTVSQKIFSNSESGKGGWRCVCRYRRWISRRKVKGDMVVNRVVLSINGYPLNNR